MNQINNLDNKFIRDGPRLKNHNLLLIFFIILNIISFAITVFLNAAAGIGLGKMTKNTSKFTRI
jgi:hypothetical protein